MHQQLQHAQWLFLDPSVLVNENETDRDLRRLVATSLGRRGRPVSQEQVERAWMQAISAPRPVHPLQGAVQLLVSDQMTVSAVLDEVIRGRRNLDTLFSGVQLALHALQSEYKVGVISPYRLPGTRERLERFHLNFPIIAVGDELNLSHRIEAHGRPDPALFVWALRKAGCPGARAAFVSDKVDLGLAPAKMAGMTTVWLRVTNHKLRYPRNSTEQPDVTAGSLAELAR